MRPNWRGHRVKIYTRSMNIELYRYSQRLIDLPFPRKRVVNADADTYLYNIIGDYECDIAINIDEDAFVIDSQSILELMDQMLKNDVAVAGMPDGGMVTIRSYNPIVVNPFFSILNLTLIRQHYSMKEIIHYDYPLHRSMLQSQFPPEKLKFDNDGFSIYVYEPFYNLFFYLAEHHRILYLEAEEWSDKITTTLLNTSGKPMMYHTWYSRLYDTDTNQRQRITSVIKQAYTEVGKRKPWGGFLRGRRRYELTLSQWRKQAESNWVLRHLLKPPTHYIDWLKRQL